MRTHARHPRVAGRVRPRHLGDHLAHPCPRTDQDVRRVHRGGRRRLRRRARRIVRVPGPERRRQDVDDADDRLCLAHHRRHAADHGHGPGDGRSADPRTARRRAPAGHPRHGADGPREPHHLRPLLRAHPGRGRQAGRRTARLRPAHRTRRRPGRAAVRRHEAAPDDRPIAHQRADDPAPRRAHDRPRPTGPAPALGPAVPAQAARRDPRPDDPLHGRGRAAVRPARGHGQGEDRGRGQPARAHRAVFDEGSHGASLPA